MAFLALKVLNAALVVIVTMVPIGCTMTTPTPYAFKPSSYNEAKATSFDYSDISNMEANFRSDGRQVASADNVVYVDKSDYDELAAKTSASDTEGDGEPLDAKAFSPNQYSTNLDQFSRLGALGPAEIYRLLALGRQPANDRSPFGGILNRITDTLPTSLDNVDHCPERPEIGIQYYCMKLEDGLYYDPWNPWCGFIRCAGGIAERICCKKGTWLGPGVMFQPFYKTNQKAMCRRPLHVNIMDGKCPMPSTKDICKAAIKVEKMNPPNPRPDITSSQFSKIDLSQFSRLKPRLSPSPQHSRSSSGKVKSDDQSETRSDDVSKLSS